MARILVCLTIVGWSVVVVGLLLWARTPSSVTPPASYCFDAQVYVPTPLGTILQGDQQVCIGPMIGPSKKGSTL